MNLSLQHKKEVILSLATLEEIMAIAEDISNKQKPKPVIEDDYWADINHRLINKKTVSADL